MKLADFNPGGMISQLEGWKRCCEFIRGDVESDHAMTLSPEEKKSESLRLVRSMSRNMADMAKDLSTITE